MGAEISTLVLGHLRHRTIDDILQDVDIVSKLVAAIPSLSSTARENLHVVKINSTKMTRAKSSPQVALQNTKLRPLLRITANHLHLSNIVQFEFSKWLNSWNDFLDVSTTDGITGTDLKDFLMKKYNLTIQLEKRRIFDRFRWRFFTLFFYDLKVMYTSSGYNPKQAMDKLVNMLATADASDYVKNNVINNLKRWIRIGLRYHSLATSLGCVGCLFLLPESINDNVWEDYLPIKGADHEKTIAILESADIKQKCESVHAGMIGTNIRQGLLEPFKWHHSTSARPEVPSNPTARIDQGLTLPAIRTPNTIDYSTPSLDSTGNNRSAMDILSVAAVLEQPIPENSNLTYPTITELNINPSQLSAQSQQNFASQNVHRQDMFELTSFDISPPSVDTCGADMLTFSTTNNNELRYNFAALVSNDVQFENGITEMPRSFLSRINR
ncbi:hypothetical protein ACHAO1_011254 [Botrytis cinerea]